MDDNALTPEEIKALYEAGKLTVKDSMLLSPEEKKVFLELAMNDPAQWKGGPGSMPAFMGAPAQMPGKGRVPAPARGMPPSAPPKALPPAPTPPSITLSKPFEEAASLQKKGIQLKGQGISKGTDAIPVKRTLTPGEEHGVQSLDKFLDDVRGPNTPMRGNGTYKETSYGGGLGGPPPPGGMPKNVSTKRSWQDVKENVTGSSRVSLKKRTASKDAFQKSEKDIKEWQDKAEPPDFHKNFVRDLKKSAKLKRKK